jgi:Domain of unknown function (DUF4357)
VHAFEQINQPARASAIHLLYCRGKGAEATGYESTQGFVVKHGSRGVLEHAPSMLTRARGYYDQRLSLIERSVLVKEPDGYCFTQDYAFSSPSGAAAVVLARAAKGRIEWRDAQARTLKDLRAREANDELGRART